MTVDADEDRSMFIKNEDNFKGEEHYSQSSLDINSSQDSMASESSNANANATSALSGLVSSIALINKTPR